MSEPAEDPDLSRRLAGVLSSRYFFPPVPEGGDMAAYVAALERLDAERDLLSGWCESGRPPEEWPADAQEILASATKGMPSGDS